MNDDTETRQSPENMRPRIRPKKLFVKLERNSCETIAKNCEAEASLCNL